MNVIFDTFFFFLSGLFNCFFYVKRFRIIQIELDVGGLRLHCFAFICILVSGDDLHAVGFLCVHCDSFLFTMLCTCAIVGSRANIMDVGNATCQIWQ